MTDEAKIIRDVLALESLVGAAGFKKSFSGADAFMLQPIASVSITPISTAQVNSTTTPTPSASLATRPLK